MSQPGYPDTKGTESPRKHPGYPFVAFRLTPSHKRSRHRSSQCFVVWARSLEDQTHRALEFRAQDVSHDMVASENWGYLTGVPFTRDSYDYTQNKGDIDLESN